MFNPTPIRQRLRTFLTPSIADFIVAEGNDVSFREIPEYGTAHPDAFKYPEHKFCYASPADDQGLKYTLLYAMERANQDDYNWELGSLELGGTRFPSITRTYVTLRARFTPDEPEINAVMPDVPVGRFTGSFLLFDKDQVRSQDKELDSLFVVEKHIYLDHTGGQVKTVGQDSLIPLKYRRQITNKQTVTLHDLTDDAVTIPPGDLIPDPGTLTGNQNKIEIAKFSDDQFLKTVGEEVITESAEPLAGRIAYAERNTAATSELLVVDGTAEERGLYIIDSRVTPLGNGKSVKETTTADAPWPVHTGSRWSDELEAPILFTEQFVAPDEGLDEDFTDVSIVNKDRSLKRTEVPPTEALIAYHAKSPCRVNLGDLPRELLAVNVVWNEQSSIGVQAFAFNQTVTGESWNLSGDGSDQASSSASLMPEVQLRFRDIASSNLPGTKHEFYIATPVTEAKILDRLNAKAWPVFKPESETISAVGQSIRISVSAQASINTTMDDGEITRQGWSKGTSDDFGVGLSQNSIQLPACIHKAISFTGSTYRSRVVSATALIAITSSAAGSVTATQTKTGTAYGRVEPSSLSATGTHTSIPTKGIYLIGEANVGRPRWGYSLVTAITFNASVLA